MEKTLIDFGNYLLSDQRMKNVTELNKNNVTDADISNFRMLQKWTVVDENLPKNNEPNQVIVNVLPKPDGEPLTMAAVLYDGEFFSCEYWQKVGIDDRHDIIVEMVTHYMELPQPIL